MNVNVAPLGAGTISCLVKMPENFNSIHETTTSSIHTPSPGLGYCLLQVKKGSSHFLQSLEMQVQQYENKVDITAYSPAFVMIVCLEGEIGCHAAVPGFRNLCEQTGNLLYITSGTISLHYNTQSPCGFIALYYPEDLVLQFPNQYPLLQVLREKMNLKLDGWLHTINRTIHRNQVDQLEKLQFKTYEPELFSLYLRAKATELLLAMLDEFSQEPDHDSKSLKLSKWDTEQLHALKKWLTENSDEPGTMTEIVHRFGLNTFKVKRGFRQLFGVSAFGYVLRIRMKRAHILLRQSNESVNNIGLILGYKNLFSFVRAFKKYYGYSPAEYRKQNETESC